MFKGLETQHKLSHHQNIEENKNKFNFTKEIERFNQLYNVGSKVSVFALYRKLKVAHRFANKMTFSIIRLKTTKMFMKLMIYHHPSPNITKKKLIMTPSIDQN